MHFEFMGTPEDANAMTEKARLELAEEVEELTPEQEEAISRMATFLDTLTEKLGKRSRGRGGRRGLSVRRREAGSPRPS